MASKSNTKSSTKKSSGKTGEAKVKSKPENTIDSEISTLSEIQTLAYSQKTWVNGETIYAEDLNHMEDGIAGAATDASSAMGKAQEVADSAITGVRVNGVSQPVKSNIAELTIGGGSGDSKIVHGSFGEFGEIELTGAGMIILSGDNHHQNIFSFCGKTVAMLDGSQNYYGNESTSDGVEIYDNYGFTETLYTIIYV